jgi:plasmid stability protein
MTDLLITNIDPELLGKLEQSAQKQGRSVSDEAKRLIRTELGKADPQICLEPARAVEGGKLGTRMFDLIHPEDRGDDLVFEYRDSDPKPREVE